jgi:hypothetical protein
MAVTLSLAYKNNGAIYMNSNINTLPAPKTGQTSSINSTVWNNGTTAASGVTVNAYAVPGGIFSGPNAPTFGTVMGYPVSPGASTNLSSVPANNLSATALNLWAVPSNDLGVRPDGYSSVHTCVIVTASCADDPLTLTSSTPWSTAQNDPHVGWHNYTVIQVPIGEGPGAEQAVQVSVLAEPAATRTSVIQTRRVPLSQHLAAFGAAAPDTTASDSAAQFTHSGQPSGQLVTFGDTQAEIIHFNIHVPQGVKAGTSACFDLVAIENGQDANGYRVLLQFV